MKRQFWVLIHRYAGLYLTFFLIIAGVTGSILAFYQELDDWLNPERRFVAIEQQAMLDDITLVEKAQAIVPEARINQIVFNRKPGQIFEAGLLPKIDSETGKPLPLDEFSIRLNPYSGELIDYGLDEDDSIWPITKSNVMNVIYKLHFSLLLEQPGIWLLGGSALIWTLDCFVGFYLTLPPARKKASTPSTQTGKSFWSRWSVAWKIKWPSSTHRLAIDLHRAFGLWLWLMLLVIAWSAVSFNLREFIYQPLMTWAFNMPDMEHYPDLAELEKAKPEPKLDWRAAHEMAKKLLAEQAQQHDFSVLGEIELAYQPELGMYIYQAETDKNIGEFAPMLYFDGDTGQFAGIYGLPDENIGYTITMWLMSLHRARVFGLPFKIFVSAMGLVVVMLSITGLYIYLKKRKAQALKKH